MYRLVIKNGFLYGVDKFYSYTDGDEKLNRNAEFIVKVSNIVGCIEKLKFKSIGSDSYRDLEILLTGENKLSIADLFHNKNLSHEVIKDAKELIHSSMLDYNFNGCIEI